MPGQDSGEPSCSNKWCGLLLYFLNDHKSLSTALNILSYLLSHVVYLYSTLLMTYADENL